MFEIKLLIKIFKLFKFVVGIIIIVEKKQQQQKSILSNIKSQPSLFKFFSKYINRKKLNKLLLKLKNHLL